jgi:hypothetical protein
MLVLDVIKCFRAPSALPRHDTSQGIHSSPHQRTETTDLRKAFSSEKLHSTYRDVGRLTKYSRAPVRKDFDVSARGDAKAGTIAKLA